MTTAYVRSVALDWVALHSLDYQHWLWLDMAGSGLHYGTSLPVAPPSQISHIWAWSTDGALRARLDRDVDASRGGQLFFSDPGTDVEPHPCEVLPVDMMDIHDARAALGTIPGLHDGLPIQVTSVYLETTPSDVPGSTAELTAIQFIHHRRSDGDTPTTPVDRG